MPVNYPTQKKKKKPASPRKTIRPADVPHRKTMAKPRPVRPEDGMIDPRIAYLNPKRTPAKKLGRPAKTIEEQLDEASEAFMLKVVTGASFEFKGPTGKRCTGPAPVETRARVAANWLKKRRPDLTATMIQAKVQTETVPEEEFSDRDLARMISAMIFESQIGTTAETKAIAAPDYMNTLPEAEMHSAGAVPERGASGDPSPVRCELPPDCENPKSGDRFDLANGSHIRFIENAVTQARWNVFDDTNVSHGFRYTFRKAIAHAKSLPPGAGPHHIDPWQLQRAANEQAEALDHRKEAMPLPPNAGYRNIQRDPRPAWKPRRSRR